MRLLRKSKYFCHVPLGNSSKKISCYPTLKRISWATKRNIEKPLTHFVSPSSPDWLYSVSLGKNCNKVFFWCRSEHPCWTCTGKGTKKERNHWYRLRKQIMKKIAMKWECNYTCFDDRTRSHIIVSDKDHQSPRVIYRYILLVGIIIFIVYRQSIFYFISLF